MKKWKKMLVITLVTFTFVNIVAYAANIDLYSGIINRIVAVKERVLKQDSGLSRNTSEAIKNLENYLKEYETSMQSELESYKQNKADEAKQVVNEQIDKTIKQLEKEKSKLLKDYKKEIDQQIENELEQELQKLQNRYNPQ